MNTRYPVFLIVLVCGTGCIQRDRVNLNCEWTGDQVFPLDLSDPAHQRHLVADAQLAEELAIRHSDAVHGLTGFYTGYVRPEVSSECFGRLAAIIQSTHRVGRSQILYALRQRNQTFDAAVAVSFALAYLVAASIGYRLVRRRFAADELSARAVATSLLSVGFSASAIQLFSLWAVLWEMVRVGNDHLAARGTRIPWDGHAVEVFVAGLAIFWLSALFAETPSRLFRRDHVRLRT